MPTKAPRYAHASCLLREAEKDSSLKDIEIINPADHVICAYCKLPMHRVKDDCVSVPPNQYAHRACAELEEKRELTEQEKLDKYIMKLFNTTYVSPHIKKQITSFIQKYNYTYSGMLKSLVYFYEVKGNSIEKSNGGVGIIPYVYQDAYNYYYSLWLAKQKNGDKQIELFIPKVKEIVIPVPQRQVKKRQLFTFLDEEVEDGK